MRPSRCIYRFANIVSKLSCLTETYFPEAQDRARFLDGERAAGRIVGPLHGLPISVKDGFQIAGTAATIGFVSFLDHELSEKNSPLVHMLLELGAVIYVKTNIPQTLMASYIFSVDLEKDHDLTLHRRLTHITTSSDAH